MVVIRRYGHMVLAGIVGLAGALGLSSFVKSVATPISTEQPRALAVTGTENTDKCVVPHEKGWQQVSAESDTFVVGCGGLL